MEWRWLSSASEDTDVKKMPMKSLSKMVSERWRVEKHFQINYFIIVNIYIN